MGLMTLLLLFWILPVSLLATLLSYEELKKATPWLVHWIDKAPSIRALVQNTLPSTALILFNGLLPTLLECERNANISRELVILTYKSSGNSSFILR
jgi:hypothetical protein